MEELNAWIEIGKIVGIKIPNFSKILKKGQKSIEKLQNLLLLAQSKMSNLDIVMDEDLDFFSMLMLKFQQAVNKQSEYIPLMSLKIIMTAVKRKLRLRSAFKYYKKIVISVGMLENLLKNYLDKPYVEIINLALFELGLIKEEVGRSDVD